MIREVRKMHRYMDDDRLLKIELEIAKTQSLIRNEMKKTKSLIQYIELLLSDAERQRNNREHDDAWYEDPNYSFALGEIYALNCVFRKMHELYHNHKSEGGDE